jgi:hypothetical protein
VSIAQIAALICAIILLVPGGCFLIVGISLRGPYETEAASQSLVAAAAILAVAALLFWLAFRRRSRQGATPNPPPDC